MTIRFTCPSCQENQIVEDDQAGKVRRCPCGYQLIVPAPEGKKKQAAGKAGKSAEPVGAAALLDELTEADFQRGSPIDSLASKSTRSSEAKTLRRFEDQVTKKKRLKKAKKKKAELSQKKKPGKLKWILIGVISLLVVAGATVGILIATGVIKLGSG